MELQISHSVRAEKVCRVLQVFRKGRQFDGLRAMKQYKVQVSQQRIPIQGILCQDTEETNVHKIAECIQKRLKKDAQSSPSEYGSCVYNLQTICRPSPEETRVRRKRGSYTYFFLNINLKYGKSLSGG